MGVIGAEHDVVDAYHVAEGNTEGVFPGKGDEHVVVEDIAGEPAVLEGDLGDVAVLFVGHVHIHDEIRGPGELVFDDAYLELRMSLENTAEHHLGDGASGPVVLGGPEGGGAGQRRRCWRRSRCGRGRVRAEPEWMPTGSPASSKADQMGSNSGWS